MAQHKPGVAATTRAVNAELAHKLPRLRGYQLTALARPTLGERYPKLP